jgi:hypothetical protein
MVETGTTRRGIWYGWVTFASVIMIVLGIFNVLEGLVALLQNQVAFIDGDSLVVVDLTGLGVVMMVSGVLLLAAGIGLLARSRIARIAAVVIVALHLLSQIGSLGAYPVWALLMITLDVVILFALTVHWSDAPREIETAPPAGGMHSARRVEHDQQSRATPYPVNAPVGAERGGPAHAAPEGPGTAQAPGREQAQPQPQTQPGAFQSPYQAPPGQHEQQPAYQPPGRGQQQEQSRQNQPDQQPTPPGPNAGPYPPGGRPGSPAHAAKPTSGYDTGAI